MFFSLKFVTCPNLEKNFAGKTCLATPWAGGHRPSSDPLWHAYVSYSWFFATHSLSQRAVTEINRPNWIFQVFHDLHWTDIDCC